MKMYRLLKIIPSLCIGSLLVMGCEKDRYVFTMESVRLNRFEKEHLPPQNIFIKVVYSDQPEVVLGKTEPYPAKLTLPVTFALHPPPRMRLYKEHISVQLWGDSSGLVASSRIDMDEYKIIYPIDMETENESVSFSVMGSWE